MINKNIIPKKEKQTTKRVLNVTIDKELFKILEDIKKESKTTMSHTINHILIDYLKLKKILKEEKAKRNHN